MNAAQFGRYFLEFTLLYPGAYLCLAPLREHLTAPRRTFGIAAGLVTVICAVCAGVCSVLEVPSNYFLLPILIVAFWLLRWRAAPGGAVTQTAFLFAVAAVMLAVCSLLAAVLNARAETGNHEAVSLASTAVIALALSVVLSPIFTFTAVRWSAWLLGERNKQGCRVLITADAHDTKALTYGFEEAAAHLKELGYTKGQVLGKNGFTPCEL